MARAAGVQPLRPDGPGSQTTGRSAQAKNDMAISIPTWTVATLDAAKQPPICDARSPKLAENTHIRT
jgi:hypothetical protein